MLKEESAADPKKIEERKCSVQALAWPPAEQPEASLQEQPLLLLGCISSKTQSGRGQTPENILWDESRRCFAFRWPRLMCDDARQRYFQALSVLAPWRELIGINGEVTRSTCWWVRGDCLCDYAYGSDRVAMRQGPGSASFVTLMEALTEHVFHLVCPEWPQALPNSANLNLYENDSQSVGWHSDDEPLFMGRDQDCLIVSLSLGETREFWLKLRDAVDARRPEFNSTLELDLGDGDLMSMEGLCQKHTVHLVPAGVGGARTACMRPRINVTWRWICNHRKKCPMKLASMTTATWDHKFDLFAVSSKGLQTLFWAPSDAIVRWQRQCDMCSWCTGRNCIFNNMCWICRNCWQKQGQQSPLRRGPNSHSGLEHLDLELPTAASSHENLWLGFQANPKLEFSAYYFSQGVCQADLWQSVLARFNTPSPIAFEILSCPKILRVPFESGLCKMVQDTHTDVAVPWSFQKVTGVWPGNDWWQLTASGPGPWHMPTALRDHILAGERMGIIRVQDLATFLPALLADLQPSIVLDLCAAPGSCCLGVLERIDRLSAGANPAQVVANEVDTGRAASLRERCRHQSRTAERLLVTRADAAKFPHFKVAEQAASVGHSSNGYAASLPDVDELRCAVHSYSFKHSPTSSSCNPWWGLRRARVDLVLVDVPCTGDGMLRKRPDMWPTWSASRGLALFPKQLAILRRGLALVAPGGQLIYSTATLDPVQNEAVVAAAFHLHNLHEAQEVHLESLETKLPAGLMSALTPGLTQWAVPAPDFSHVNQSFFQSWPDVPTAFRVTDGSQLRQEMFSGFAASAALQCHHCRRGLPSASFDSGGFFLASFRKAAESETKRGKVVFAPRTHNIFRSAGRSINGLHPTKGCILKFYGLFAEKDEAAAHGVEPFPLDKLGIQPGSKDSIVLVSSICGALQEHKDLKVLGGGLPLLHRVCGGSSGAGRFFDREQINTVFEWRPSGEGAYFMGRCCSRRIIALQLSLFKLLLTRQRLDLEETQVPDVCFLGCKNWGDNVKDVRVPGGVIIALTKSTEPRGFGPPFFAALLSSMTIQLVSGIDADMQHFLFASLEGE